MSLDYSFVNVRPDLPLDSEERKEWFNEQWVSGKLESLIFNTMTIGINHIKDETTARKFYARYLKYYAACGYDTYYDLDFVISMVGLRTNASTITDAAFNKELIEALERRTTVMLKGEH